MKKVIPDNVREALNAISDYLWKDALASYADWRQPPAEKQHIFLAAKTTRRWLKETSNPPGGRAGEDEPETL